MEEYVSLCGFVAALSSRTEVQREHHRDQWQRVLEKGKSIEEWVESASEEEIERASMLLGPSTSEETMSMEDVKSVMDQTLQTIVPITVEALTPHLVDLDFAIFSTDPKPGSITGDVPVVWRNPEAYKLPPAFRTPALTDAKIEITIPISSSHCIYFNRVGIRGIIPVPSLIVEEMNRRVQFQAKEQLVVNSNVLKDVWFDEVPLPNSSWESKHKQD